MRDLVVFVMSRELFDMKHLLFLIILSAVGTVGAVVHPFYGVLLYYMLAVLRPQALWEWALPHGIRWSLLAAAATMVGLVLSLPRIALKLRWNGVATLLVVFALLILVSAINAYNQRSAWHWATEYGKIFIMAIIATVVIDHLRFVRYLSWMVLIGIGYVAWDLNALYLYQGRLDIYHYGYGGMDNNGAGLMIAMGLPFAYVCARYASWWVVKLLCLLGGAMMLHAVFMSYSRGAMLSAGVAIVWLLIHHRPRIHAAALCGLVIVGALIMAGPEIRDRFVSISNYKEDGSAQSRFISWKAAWAIAWDHPLTGVGVRNSHRFVHNYGNDHRNQTTHSQYLQVAADNGILAMGVYIGICLLSLYSLYRARKHMLQARATYRHAPPDRLPVGTHRPGPTDEYADIALAIQASLLTFVFGGIFLSLEVFELPWLLFTVAGVMPSLVEERYPITPKTVPHAKHRRGRRREERLKEADAEPTFGFTPEPTP